MTALHLKHMVVYAREKISTRGPHTFLEKEPFLKKSNVLAALHVKHMVWYRMQTKKFVQEALTLSAEKERCI